MRTTIPLSRDHASTREERLAVERAFAFFGDRWEALATSRRPGSGRRRVHVLFICKTKRDVLTGHVDDSGLENVTDAILCAALSAALERRAAAGVPPTSGMAPKRDDPVTRAERLVDLLEKFHACDSNERATLADLSARARAARDRAADIRARRWGAERVEPAFDLTKRLEVNSTDSADAHRTSEAVLRARQRAADTLARGRALKKSRAG
jgi:hypothetical protein